MHGGVNDAWDSASVGVMTDSYDPADFDTSTYAGGLENLFYYVTTEHPDAKLGYIFNFATPSFNTGRIANMTEYYTVAKQICEKWNIPYLNMYEDSSITTELKTNTTEHLSDLLHPDTSGYDILYKYIMYWMETLPVNSTVTDAYDLETLPSEVA
jgi:lysophospholipase L1-like esterase